MVVRSKYRRCRIEDIYVVAEALNERLFIQIPHQQPTVSDGRLILTKNATDTRWFRALANAATAICFPTGRLKETTTMQGPALFYFGEDVDLFNRLSSEFGRCWIPERPRAGGAA